MMKLVFTRNKLPLSKLICWATDENVSHVALVFDNKYVFHSNLNGVHIDSWPQFCKMNTIVAEKVYDLPLEVEEEAFQSMVVIEGKWYDIGGLLFWGLAILRKKFFGLDLPTKNLWASDDFFTCVEILRMLPSWIWPPDLEIEVIRGELTPGQAAKILGAQWL